LYISISAKEWALGGVFVPLWLEIDIVVHLLMSEEELLVCPFGLSHGAIELESSNLNLFTSHLCWLIQSIDIIKDGICWYGLKLSNKGHWVVVDHLFWEEGLDFSIWLECQREWEDLIVVFLSGGIVLRKIR